MDTAQAEINLNFLTATWSTNYTDFTPLPEKNIESLLAVPYAHSLRRLCFAGRVDTQSRTDNNQGKRMRLIRRSGVVEAGVVREKHKLCLLIGSSRS